MTRRITDRSWYRRWLFRLFLAYILVYVVAMIITSIKEAVAYGELTCIVTQEGDPVEVTCPDGMMMDIPVNLFMCQVRKMDRVMMDKIDGDIYMSGNQPDCDKHNHWNRPPN